MFKKFSFILLFFFGIIISTHGQYLQVIISTSWAMPGKGNRDTTNATADTLSRQIDLYDTSNTMVNLAPHWWQAWFASDDTIQMSSSISFPANDITIIYPAETWTTPQFDVAYTPNYYWKILGTGTASVRKKVWYK